MVSLAPVIVAVIVAMKLRCDCAVFDDSIGIQ
jgi:hypothetical protein